MPITNHHTKIEALTATIRVEDFDGGEVTLKLKDGKVYEEGIDLEIGEVIAVDYARTHK